MTPRGGRGRESEAVPADLRPLLWIPAFAGSLRDGFVGGGLGGRHGGWVREWRGWRGARGLLMQTCFGIRESGNPEGPTSYETSSPWLLWDSGSESVTIAHARAMPSVREDIHHYRRCGYNPSRLLKIQ